MCQLFLIWAQGRHMSLFVCTHGSTGDLPLSLTLCGCAWVCASSPFVTPQVTHVSVCAVKNFPETGYDSMRKSRGQGGQTHCMQTKPTPTPGFTHYKGNELSFSASSHKPTETWLFFCVSISKLVIFQRRRCKGLLTIRNMLFSLLRETFISAKRFFFLNRDAHNHVCY